MYEVYKISDEQLAAAALRTIKTALKGMVITYMLVTVYIAWRAYITWKYFLLGSAVCIPAYALALLLGYLLLKQRYRRYRIVLDDDGIEFYMPPNDKKIKWEDVTSKVKSNGILVIYDRKKSAFSRWLTGEGSIAVLPELNHFHDLKNNIERYTLKPLS